VDLHFLYVLSCHEARYKGNFAFSFYLAGPFSQNCNQKMSVKWHCTVGIVMGCRLDSKGSIPSRSKRCSPLHDIPTACGGPSSVPGSLSPRVKRPGREADHPPLRSRVVKLYFHSPICLQGIVLN
jgi:hypothetical protein